MRLLILEQEHPPDLAVYAEGLAPLGVELVTASSEDEAAARGGAAQLLVAKAHAVSQRLVDSLPALAWIQALTTGTDHLATLALPAGVWISSMRGIHGPQMAELTFLDMLALLRDLPRLQANQRAARWQRWPQRLLLGRTAVLVGIGAISEALARRCQAFGMRVLGVSDARSAAEGFDAVLPRTRLAEAAAQADFLVVLVPYGPETHHLVDAAVLAAMRPDAFLINVARGRVIDEVALVSALEAGLIAGAGLDVFETEPLPASSPLWAMPNVIVTPRIGGMSDRYAEQALPVLVGNLRAWQAGNRAALRNLVRAGQEGRVTA